MKFEPEVLKNLLETIESVCDGSKTYSIEGNSSEDREYARQAHHLKILLDRNFAEGEAIMLLGRGVYPSGFDIYHLTFEGHQLLDSMRSEKLAPRMKKLLAEVGVEGLKQIPALAIQALLPPSS